MMEMIDILSERVLFTLLIYSYVDLFFWRNGRMRLVDGSVTHLSGVFVLFCLFCKSRYYGEY